MPDTHPMTKRQTIERILRDPFLYWVIAYTFANVAIYMLGSHLIH
jgi:hypothetical protein